jgi:hypothetical protein
MVLDAIAGLQFILQGKFNHFMAILKAHGSFYRLFSVHYKKRDKFQSQKYYNEKSIVYLYFIKKVRIFKHLFNS